MRRFRRPQLALIVLVVALAIGYTVRAATSSDAPSRPGPAPAVVKLSSLPVQARETVALIRKGGPFPYPADDGVVFHNDEHLLPAERGGYYHEYTVPTPGEQTRGPRRIVTGAGGEFYYTADHYEHFVRVDVTS